MRSMYKLTIAVALAFCAPHFVAAEKLSDTEQAERGSKARAQMNEFIGSFTYEFELKSLRIAKGWFYLLNSATVTVKLEAGHYEGFNQFKVDFSEVKELEIRKNQIDILSEPLVLKVPAEALFVREYYGKPKIYLQISVSQNGSELYLSRPAVQLEASYLQRHRRLLLGTDYIQGAGYKNIPWAFPLLIPNGDSDARSAQVERGSDSAVLVVHRRPIDTERQKVLAAQFAVGGRAFMEGYPEFKITALKPEAGIIIGRGRGSYPMVAELALSHPINPVQSLGGISVGDCIVGFSGARETVAELTEPGFVSVWSTIGGSNEREPGSFAKISEVKKVDCTDEAPQAAQGKEDDDD